MERRDTVEVFGVRYLHLALPGGADLYLTEFGLPFSDLLRPEHHWGDKTWFRANSTKLFGHEIRSAGSSTIYRVHTKPVRGKSKEIVLKWNRMGQDIPGEDDREELFSAEFNSPFEEFSLLIEMRNACIGISGRRILTHKPLAIYVAPEPIELWRIGRKEYKMHQMMRNHPEIKLDMYRRYAVIYEWIKGVDLFESYNHGLVTGDRMAAMTRQVDNDLNALGFTVRDRKPQHIIVRLDNHGGLRRDEQRGVPYALVDFELLERTPKREKSVRVQRRRDYLDRQAHRFEVRPIEQPVFTHLRPVSILGVDYISGLVELTGGLLWVVGKDKNLFDYFLPERWQHSSRTRLSSVDEVYETTTKDSIHVVWKISRVGRIPDLDPFRPEEKEILDYGFNSPFEEVAFALELEKRGVPATYPRAIYMTGHSVEIAEYLRDNSRYHSHARFLTEDGTPILRADREYATVWGYWNKPDSLLAKKDRDYYSPVDALRALRQGIIEEQTYLRLMAEVHELLRTAGFEDLEFRGHHKLLSLDASGQLLLEEDGLPQFRICNFELIREMATQPERQ